MFWKTQTDEASTGIANLLNKENVTLKEVLDDAYALQELKCSNQRLVDYLKQPANLTELTKLTLTEPPECPSENGAKRFKYFHLASEILSADSEQVTSALSQNQESFQCLSNFVKTKQTLNPLLASSFAKVFSLLAQRFPSQTLNFMQNDSEFLDNCLYHLETYAIADALFRICACIENDDEATKIRTWLCEKNFVAKLVSKFADVDAAGESHVNAAFLMNELIRCLRDLIYSRDDKTVDPLLEQFQSRTILDSLLSNMFALPRNNSVLVNGCSIFLTLLQTLPTSFNLTEWNYSKTIEDGLQDEHAKLRVDDQWSPDADGVTLSCLNNKLEDFVKLISNKQENLTPMLSPMGPIELPFGCARLMALKLVTQMVTTSSLEIHQHLSDLNVFETLFDCFFAYPYNNFLHSCVFYFVYYVLNLHLKSPNGDKMPSPLLKQVFKNGTILKMLMEKYETNQKENRKRSTNFGHLMKIADIFDQSMTSGHNVDFIKDIFKDFPQDFTNSWSNFVNDVLNPYRKLNEPDPVGLQSSSNLDILQEDGLPPVSTSMHHQNQRFVEYQSQQMTEPFPEPTGFPPDTFTSDHQDNINECISKTTDIGIKLDGKEKFSPPGESAFDAICNQRINTMDSDEDDWPEREITFTSSSVITNQRNDNKTQSFVNKRPSSSSSSSGDDENVDHHSSKMVVDQGPSDWANFQTANDSTSNKKDDWATFGSSGDSNVFESQSKKNKDDDDWANFESAAPLNTNKSSETSTASSNDWATNFFS